MSGKDSFLLDERKNIEKAVLIIEDLSSKSDAQFEGLLELLLFRHMHIHGYGFMLDEKRLRQLAAPVPSLTQSFLGSL